MAKVLISFLGTGRKNDDNTDERDYKHTKYCIDDKEYDSAFISKALVVHYKIDNIYLFGTTKSMWEEAYLTFTDHHEIECDYNYYDELKKIASESDETTPLNVYDFSQLEAALGNSSRVFLVKHGKNQEEDWFNFAQLLKVQEHLNNGDEVYIDITHSFRSLSFLLLLSMLYYKDFSGKEIEFKGIYYGMFKGKKAEVITLSVIESILNWSKAANAFTKYGDMTDLIELLSSNKKNKRFIDRTKKFMDDLQLNKISGIKNSANSFIAELNNLEKLDDNTVKPMSIVKDALLEFPRSIVKPDIKDWEILLQIAKRYKDNGQVGFAILSTWEAIVNRIALVFELNLEEKRNNKSYDYYKFCAKIARKEDHKKILNINLYYDELKDFPKKAKELSDMRNTIAHLRGKKDDKIEDIPSKFLGKDGLFNYFVTTLPNKRFNQIKKIEAINKPSKMV